MNFEFEISRFVCISFLFPGYEPQAYNPQPGFQPQQGYPPPQGYQPQQTHTSNVVVVSQPGAVMRGGCARCGVSICECNQALKH